MHGIGGNYRRKSYLWPDIGAGPRLVIPCILCNGVWGTMNLTYEAFSGRLASDLAKLLLDHFNCTYLLVGTFCCIYHASLHATLVSIVLKLLRAQCHMPKFDNGSSSFRHDSLHSRVSPVPSQLFDYFPTTQTVPLRIDVYSTIPTPPFALHIHPTSAHRHSHLFHTIAYLSLSANVKPPVCGHG